MPRAIRPSRALFLSAAASIALGLVVISGQNRPAGAGGMDLPARDSDLLKQGRALPDYDVRGYSSVSLEPAQVRSAADLKRALGAETSVQFDPRSGGGSHIFQPGGYLTEAQPGAPSAVLNRFLVEHADVFGLSQVGVSGFESIAEDLDNRTGVTHLYLAQRMGGLQVFGSVLKGHVDQLGRVISVEAHYYPASLNPTPIATVSAEGA